MSEIFATREEKFCISKRPCNVLLIYYINTNEIPNHFAETVFSCERRDLLCSHSDGDIFTCEDNMLFSHLKISSFCSKAHLVFHWCLHNKYVYSPVYIFYSLQGYVLSVELPSSKTTTYGLPFFFFSLIFLFLLYENIL